MGESFGASDLTIVNNCDDRGATRREYAESGSTSRLTAYELSVVIRRRARKHLR